jgi:uncharacterized protein YdhG (YjbR/CyaY superfamily)
MAKPTTVEEYLAALPEERRATMKTLRRTINAAAPGMTETIAYDMPALRTQGGHFLVSYASYKHHYSLFPASAEVIDALGAELTPYLSGKGTIHFPAKSPVPMELVVKVVKARVAEKAAGADR